MPPRLVCLGYSLLRYIFGLAQSHKREDRFAWGRCLRFVLFPCTKCLGLVQVTRNLRLGLADAIAFDFCCKIFHVLHRAQTWLNTSSPCKWIKLAMEYDKYRFDIAKSDPKYALTENGCCATVKYWDPGRYQGCLLSKMPEVSKQEIAGALEETGAHYFEFQIANTNSNEEDGDWVYGFCRPDIDVTEDDISILPGSWIVWQSGSNWYTHTTGASGKLDPCTSNENRFHVGTCVGILLDFNQGTTSIIWNGQIVDASTMTGVTGPLLPCIGIFPKWVSVRIRGHLHL